MLSTCYCVNCGVTVWISPSSWLVKVDLLDVGKLYPMIAALVGMGYVYVALLNWYRPCLSQTVAYLIKGPVFATARIDV